MIRGGVVLSAARAKISNTPQGEGKAKQSSATASQCFAERRNCKALVGAAKAVYRTAMQWACIAWDSRGMALIRSAVGLNRHALELHTTAKKWQVQKSCGAAGPRNERRWNSIANSCKGKESCRCAWATHRIV